MNFWTTRKFGIARYSLLLLGGLLVSSILMVSAQTPAKVYRTQAAASANGGIFVNDFTPRSISAFFPPGVNTNNQTVTTTFATTSVSTNLAGASITDTTTNYSLQATNVVSLTTQTASEDLPIRSLTVTVVFQAEFPVGLPGTSGLIFSLQRGTDAPVTILQTGPSIYVPLVPSNAVGFIDTITIDASSVQDIRQSVDLAENQGSVTATFKPITQTAFDSFTNESSLATWTLQLNNQTTNPNVWLLGFTVNIISDPNGVTITQNGAPVTYETGARVTETFEPEDPNEASELSIPLPRFLTER